MDARFLRAARFFVVLTLVTQMTGLPAIGESVRTISEITVAPVAKAPVLHLTPRNTGVVKPVIGGGGTRLGSPAIGRGTTPRKRPSAQGPVTYAGTSSLNFTPVSEYAGFATTAAGTLTPVAGYTYAVNYGDGATSAIALAANGNTVFSFGHTYASASTYNATVVATDPTNGNATIIVTQPIVISQLSGNLSNPSAVQNTATTFVFSGTVPAMNPPPAPGITIAFGDGSTTTDTYAASVSFTHTYTNAGTYSVSVIATATQAVLATQSVGVSASARAQGDNGTIGASPTSVYQGAAVTLSGTGGQVANEVVNFGDGTATSAVAARTAYSFSHMYATTGSFTANLQEAVAGGATTTLASSVVTVAPISGSLNAATVAPGNASSIVFEGTIPANNAPAPPTVTLAFGDGTQTTFAYAANETVSHTYAGPGTYTLTATANGNTIVTGTAIVAAPTMTLVANPTSIYTGSSVQFAFTYPAGVRISATQCVIDFNDGTTQQFLCGSMNFTHTYTATATTTRTASVSTAGNAGAQTTAPVTVYPLAGTFSSNPVTVGSASSITFTGQVPAANPPAAPQVTIAFGDGQTTTVTYGTTAIPHTYAQSGTYNLTASVGQVVIGTGTTTVNPAATNIGGTISANPNDVYAGASVTLSGTAPAMVAGNVYYIAFGDGTNSPNITAGQTYSIAHTYATAGADTATLEVNQPANGTTTAVVTAAVTVAPLAGTFSSNPVTLGSASTITFTGQVPSMEPSAPPQVTITFGDGSTTTVTYGNATFAHTYARPGTYNLTAIVGNATIATGTTVVNAATNIGGTISANPANVYAGSPVTLSGTAPQFVTGNTYFIAFGDGTNSPNITGGQGYNYAHTYATAAQYTATLEVTNQGSGATTPVVTAAVMVAALSGTFTAPTVMLGNMTSVTFTGAVPANPPAPPQVTIAFGDGQTTTVTYGTATVQHMYQTMGTFALTATANGTTIATGQAVVTPASIGISASPAALYSGSSTTFTVTYPANVTAATQCTLTFGDGTSQTFTCGPQMISHTYTVGTSTVETASVGVAGQPAAASTNVNVIVPSATLSLSSPTIFSGSTESVTIATDAIANATGPSLTLDFGDGTAPLTNLAFQNQTIAHGYARSRSLGTNHRFVAPGNYTLRLSDAAGTLATVTVTVVTPSVTLTPANANAVPGTPEIIALAVGDLGGLAGPMLSVDYGDGSAVMVTYANATLTHTYSTAGNYTITVGDGAGTLATQAITVYQPSATITLNPSPVLLGAPTAISVNVTPIGTAVGPAPLTLNFGDGTTTVLPAYANASFNHTYPAVGTYTATLSAPGFGTIGSNIVNVVHQNQALVVPPAPVAANAPADIVVNVTPPAGFGVMPLLLEFGDGTSIVVTATGTYPHVYASPGIYTVTLINQGTGLTVSTQQITILGVTPRVPVGQIYSQSFTNSPVLAGGATNILIQWSAAVPSLGTILDPIEGYVDLLDAKGRLVRRSDPFELPGDTYSGPGIHSTQIPYDTPVDAHGTYQTRVVLRSTQGGTITVGPPATLIIIGGPDPSFKANVNFHDTGSIEVGPHAGQPGATFDPGMSLGFLSPNYAGTVSGIFDPISRRSDPLITVKSGKQTQIASPDSTPAPVTAATSAPAAVTAANSPQNSDVNRVGGAPNSIAPSSTPVATTVPGTPPNANYGPAGTPAPSASPSPIGASSATPDPRQFALPDRAAAYATPSVSVAGPVAATAPPAPATTSNPVPHDYTELGGRGQLTLPDALGGGSTLRGLDVNDILGPVTYQVGYGYSALATASTSAQRATVGDITRTLGSDGSVRVTYFGRQDDPFKYPLMTGQTGPLQTDSELLALSAPTVDGFKLSLSGALSSAHALEASDYYRTDDAADKFGLTYTHNSYTAAFDYHNAGPLFAVGSGPGATADRVGFASAVAAPLGNAVQVALNYTKDEARSAFSRQSDAGATFTFALPKSSTLSLAAKRDTQLAPTANTRNDSATAAIGTHIGIGTLALNAGISSAQDLINSVNSAVTRTGSIQYALQSNGHSLGVGINATMVQALGPAPMPMMTATPDPTIGDPSAVIAPGGVGSSMVQPVSGPGGNAQIGETLTYGFPFGGRVVNGAIVHGLELQLTASNSASHAFGTGGYDQDLGGILSYHLSAHLAVGLRTDQTWHGDELDTNRHKASAIRLRLDLTQ